MLTNDELVAKARAEIAEAGSLNKWAKAHGVDRGVIHKSMAAPQMYPVIAALLGYRRTERIWERIDKESAP